MTNCDGRSAISAAALNAIRRTAIDELNSLQRKNHTPTYTLTEVPALPKNTLHRLSALPEYWIQVRTMEQLHAVQNSRFPVRRIVLPLALAEQLNAPISEAILTLPTFAPDDDPLQQRLAICRANGWTDVLCDTTAHLILGKQAGFTLHGGTGLNIVNRHSIAVLQQFWCTGYTAFCRTDCTTRFIL